VFRNAAITTLILFLLTGTSTAWAKKWQTGTLMSADRQDGERNLERHQQTQGSDDGNGNYSSSSSTTVGQSQLYYKYMVYTITTTDRVYVCRQVVNLPWVRTASGQIGHPVEFVVDKTKLIIRDDEGKEIKTELLRTAVRTGAPTPPQQ
jgi:hypothetical protein